MKEKEKRNHYQCLAICPQCSSLWKVSEIMGYWLNRIHISQLFQYSLEGQAERPNRVPVNFPAFWK